MRFFLHLRNSLEYFNRHAASRGLSTTAEPLVLAVVTKLKVPVITVSHARWKLGTVQDKRHGNDRGHLWSHIWLILNGAISDDFEWHSRSFELWQTFMNAIYFWQCFSTIQSFLGVNVRIRAILRLVWARVLCEMRAPYRPMTTHKKFPLPPIAGPQNCMPGCCSTPSTPLMRHWFGWTSLTVALSRRSFIPLFHHSLSCGFGFLFR